VLCPAEVVDLETQEVRTSLEDDGEEGGLQWAAGDRQSLDQMPDQNGGRLLDRDVWLVVVVGCEKDDQ
jgi:hypothetical protein